MAELSGRDTPTAASTKRWPFYFSARTDADRTARLIDLCRSGFFRRLLALDPWGTK